MTSSLPESDLHERRERVFLVLAGIFLGTLAMLNILGITRFLDFSFELFGVLIPFEVAVGVLPYPITFLCTDLISEFYGKARANFVVWVGLGLNIWVVFILWLGGVLPGTDSPAFFEVRTLAFGAVTASMIAYLAAQLCDVRLFHFLKQLTKGKHLWLRNNGSTIVSQLVDTVAVICITWYLGALPAPDVGQSTFDHLMFFILSGYVFKVAIALLDTGPFYLCVHLLSKYLKMTPLAVDEPGNSTK